MATNFRYVPLAPEPISGPSFVSQTEAAINELGTRLDTTEQNAGDALRIANQALSTANDALETAQNAITTANTAQNTADAAQLTADEALALAGQALREARQAQSDADAAMLAAQVAQSTGELAQAGVEEVRRLAQEIREIAIRANEIASEAITIALSSRGVYQVVQTDRVDEEDGTVEILEEVNADEYFIEPEKKYITGGTILNFPVDEGPFYFEILVNDDSTSATQRVWTQDNDTSWTRIATIVYDEDDPEADPEVTWTDWKLVGSGILDEEWEAQKATFFGLVVNDDHELEVHVAEEGETVKVSDYPCWSILPRGSYFTLESTSELFLTLP